jgi:hypothetical protein
MKFFILLTLLAQTTFAFAGSQKLSCRVVYHGMQVFNDGLEVTFDDQRGEQTFEGITLDKAFHYLIRVNSKGIKSLYLLKSPATLNDVIASATSDQGTKSLYVKEYVSGNGFGANCSVDGI